MSHRFFSLVALLALAGCTAPATVGTTNRAAIGNRVSGQVVVWARAVNNRSMDTLGLLYQPDRNVVSVWPDGSRVMGWSDLSKKWQGWLASASQLNLVADSPDIQVLDTRVALATFTASADVVAGGARSKDTHRVSQVWVLDAEGRWRIAAEHRSIVPPAIP